MKRHGSYYKLSIKDRLIKNRKIDLITNCWLWIKAKDKNGYGAITIDKKVYRVHRIAYKEYIGPIKNHILHKLICLNKNCFNPDHLYDGTQEENNQDTLNSGHHISGFKIAKRNKDK